MISYTNKDECKFDFEAILPENSFNRINPLKYISNISRNIF